MRMMKKINKIEMEKKKKREVKRKKYFGIHFWIL